MKQSVLVLGNSDSGLYDFRKEVLTALMQEGYEVHVSVPDTGYLEKIKKLGCICHETVMERRGMNPLKDGKLLLFYRKLLKTIHPAAVLTYTIKPNIYGGVACRLAKVPYLVNITGLGTTLEHDGPLQKLIVVLYRTGMSGAAVEAAKEDGKIRKWGGKLPPNLKLPLRDGDIDRPDDENYQEHFFLNATSKDAPQVVDRHVQPVVDPMMVYSGCYCNVSVNFYPFNANGNRGVAVGLGNIQFVKDGDRLSGRASADADFDALEDDEDVLGGDAGEELPDYLR